jgi:hypothetical protein
MINNNRTRLVGGRVETYDFVTQETVNSNAPIFFQDDFIGGRGNAFPTTATAGEPWVKKIVGAAPPTVNAVANAAGGQVSMALTSTSEKQDAVLYFADNLCFDVTKNLVFEAVAQLSVLPSAAGVQAVFGLQSAWIDGPDNASFYLGFGALANGTILMRSYDGTTRSAVSTGITFSTTDQHVCRIDARNVADIRFFIDGVDVTGAIGTISFAATGASAVLQPYASMYKPSGTGVGTLTLDKVDCMVNRS